MLGLLKVLSCPFMTAWGKRQTPILTLKLKLKKSSTRSFKELVFPGESATILVTMATKMQRVKDLIIYYLVGYTHKKLAKAISCKKCQSTLTAEPKQLSCNGSILHQHHLTELISFKLGCLCKPSVRQYIIIKK